MASEYINESFTGNDSIIEEGIVKETDIKANVYESLQKTKDCEVYQTLEKTKTNQEVDAKRCKVISRKKMIYVLLIFLSVTAIGTLIGPIILFASATKTDGSWESWQMWSNCSASCGGGFRTRSRTCSNPPPSPFGRYCQGNSIDIDSCENKNCDVCQSRPCNAGICISKGENFDCVCLFGYGGRFCENIVTKDCLDILRYDGNREDGVYTVRTGKSHQLIQVYCDMTTDGGGWTVFQYRFNGSVDFYRNFYEYEEGFGNLKTEFWLGLRYIEELASKGRTDLRIDLEAPNGTTGFETFENFSLSAGPAYTLHIGSTIASSGISSYRRFGPAHNGMNFTTYDHDADSAGDNCAVSSHGAWWYQACYEGNLNGKYLIPGTQSTEAMNYESFLSLRYTSLKSSKMMMRRK